MAKQFFDHGRHGKHERPETLLLNFLPCFSGLPWSNSEFLPHRKGGQKKEPRAPKNLLHTKLRIAMFRAPLMGNGPGRSVRKLLRRFLSGKRLPQTNSV